MNELAPGMLARDLLSGLHAVEMRFEGALEPLGLSVAKFGVLARLMAAGEPLPLGTLAEMSACVRSNMTQLIDRLEADKLVVRLQDPRDRRSVRAELTPEGRQRHAAGLRVVERTERELFAQVPRGQREVFLQVLRSLKEA